MDNSFTAVLRKDGNWWIGWITEIPGVNCQEPTRGELLKSLEITLKEALKFNRSDAVMAAGDDYQEERIFL